jgi:two-component system response regulator GlrR
VSSSLLVVQNSSPTPEDYLRCVLTSDTVRCTNVNWDALILDKLPECKAQLILAWANPLARQAVQFFQWSKDNPISTPILALLPRDIDDEMLRIVSESAADFMLWPIHEGEFRQRLQRLLGKTDIDREFESAHQQLMQDMGMERLIGNHPVFVNAIKSLPTIAQSDLPVLITGPTGTGKELCARGIHHLSKRRNFPFIAVDCGAIPDHLFENELFGHARGAFTDAHSDQRGLAAMANGGTLFLDEIDALSSTAQVKLLRFLQERTYRPLGGERFTRADVNVIAATNCDLEQYVQEKRFRSDLYFRLNVLRLNLPPLAKRRSDIQLLARHFLQLESRSCGPKSFTRAALRKLELYDWPGNVRELLNVVQRARVLSEGLHILPTHISFSNSDAAPDVSAESFQRARNRAIESFERRYVQELLEKHNGNVTRAALESGKERRAFGRLKKKYKL